MTLTFPTLETGYKFQNYMGFFLQKNQTNFFVERVVARSGLILAIMPVLSRKIIYVLSMSGVFRLQDLPQRRVVSVMDCGIEQRPRFGTR
jgi:hypothetical protein